MTLTYIHEMIIDNVALFPAHEDFIFTNTIFILINAPGALQFTSLKKLCSSDKIWVNVRNLDVLTFWWHLAIFFSHKIYGGIY